MNRRGLLKLLGAAPVAAPRIAAEMQAKAALQAADAAKLIGTQISGLGDEAPLSLDITPKEVQKALRIPFAKEGIMEILWNQHRHVYALDPDLAVKKSFSLNAKITFQRQRNVERRFKELQEEPAWLRIPNFVRNILKF